MDTTVTTRVTLPAGTKMKWVDRPDEFSAEPEPVLVRDDGSTIPYLCRVRGRTGGESNYWFRATAVEEDLDAFPEPPDPKMGLEDQLPDTIAGVLGCLRWWCEESDVPVLDSVDEQATWLRNATMDNLPGKPNFYVCWPATGTWHSSGPGKDYLGKVMRRARKVRAEREAGQTLTAPAESATPEIDVVAVLRSQVADRDATIERLSRDLDLARRYHREDNAKIGERLLNEAEQRDWCSEFDEFVENLNPHLNIELPTRSRDVDVNYSVTLTVTLNRSTTVSVSGNDDPCDEAQEQFDSYEVESEVQRALENAYLSVDSVSVDSTDDYEEES